MFPILGQTLLCTTFKIGVYILIKRKFFFTILHGERNVLALLCHAETSFCCIKICQCKIIISRLLLIPEQEKQIRITPAILIRHCYLNKTFLKNKYKRKCTSFHFVQWIMHFICYHLIDNQSIRGFEKQFKVLKLKTSFSESYSE